MRIYDSERCVSEQLNSSDHFETTSSRLKIDTGSPQLERVLHRGISRSLLAGMQHAN